MSGIWGSVPSWLSAVGSIAALVTATLAARAAWKQVKFAADQQRHRDEKDEREQADKIAVWLTAKNADGRGSVFQFHLNYVNSSDLPAYNILISPVAFPDIVALIRVLEPTDTVRKIRFMLLEDFVRMETQTAPDSEDMYHAPPRFRAIEHIANKGVSIQFRDQGNRVWTRDENGILLASDSSSHWYRLPRREDRQFARLFDEAIDKPDGTAYELIDDGDPPQRGERLWVSKPGQRVSNAPEWIVFRGQGA